MFQGLRRPIHARESFASKSLSNKRTELLLRGVERSILADVRKSGKKEYQLMRAAVILQTRIRGAQARLRCKKLKNKGLY